jgi:hypothetical protein
MLLRPTTSIHLKLSSVTPKKCGHEGRMPAIVTDPRLSAQDDDILAADLRNP